MYGKINFLDCLDNLRSLKLVERMVGPELEVHDCCEEYDHVEKVQVGKDKMVVKPL